MTSAWNGLFHVFDRQQDKHGMGSIYLGLPIRLSKLIAKEEGVKVKILD